MRALERLILKLDIAVGILLTLLFAGWWFRPEHLPNNFHGAYHILDATLFIVLSYVIWHQITMELVNWSLVRKMHHFTSPAPQPGLKVAFITTYVPGAETPELLHNILPALVQADYPHDAWLLDEGDDAEAKEICAQYGVRYFSRKGIAKYTTPSGKFAVKTKGGNHNAWYDFVGHKYDIVAQIDTDFIPKNNFLTKTLGFFRDPTVAFVGTPQIYGNMDSWIAKGAAQQQYSFYGPILKGLFGHQMTMMLGANHVVRTSALRSIDYYAGHLTEDLLTGMTLHAKGYRSVYVAEQLAVGEGPTTWQAYFNQQLRWAQGCMDILFNHSLKLFKTMSKNKQLHYYLLQQHYFTGLASILGLVLLSIYFVFGVAPSTVFLSQMILFYAPLLLWQYLIQRRLQRHYINPEQESGFNIPGMIIGISAWPIYFMAFIGAARGKRLTFKVTPKGVHLPDYTSLKLFTPHIVIGTIAASDIASGILRHHTNPIMLFWAILTLVTMYGIAFHQQVMYAYRATVRLLNAPVRLPLLSGKEIIESS